VTSSELLFVRLLNQKLIFHGGDKPQEIVKWMGAIQAQDLNMAKLAVGIRSSNLTENDITDAYNRGDILRTHLMRPTWHFVSSEDIYWMTDLTAPQIKSAIKTRHRNLEFTGEIINKCLHIIENLFIHETHIPREKLKSELIRNNIRIDENRLAHILLIAELEKIICSGPLLNGKITYSLLSRRVPEKRSLSREESLTELSKRYFRSHSPATAKDFNWWSGLSMKDVKTGMEYIKDNLSEEVVNSERYWNWNQEKNIRNSSFLHLLPAYDEFLIGYQDRKIPLHQIRQKTIISQNGIFRPVIVLNGKVCGLWKKIRGKDKLIIELEFLKSEMSDLDILVQEISQYEKFFGKEIIWTQQS
jgi:hypothetical protein